MFEISALLGGGLFITIGPLGIIYDGYGYANLYAFKIYSYKSASAFLFISSYAF